MTRTVLLFIFHLASSMVLAQPSNDDFANAIDITPLINSCSADAAYTTNGATADLNAGSCWNNSGPQLNVWFSFVASSASISITVDRGGSKGTQQRSQVAIWESDGTTEIACKRYQINGEDVVVETLNGLTPGNTYYISVDTYSSSYRGSFTLCLSDVVSYDFFEGAIDVTGIINSCSSDQAYSTIGGSSDRNAASCWDNSGPQFNRWFSFVATSTSSMSITVDRGGTKGSQQRTQIGLWEADGVTQVACKKYQFNGEDVVLEALGLLTSGSTYYISVDTYNSSYDGTFTLCLDDQVSYDYLEGAIDVTGIINSCSVDEAYTTIGGSADRNAGSCWDNSGPKFNRWFSFVATTTSISVTIDIGDGKGTQQRSQVALWEVDGVTEVGCKRYQLNGEDVTLEAIGMLNVGDTYYISVDTYNENYDGTFTLCLDDVVSYDYYEGAVEITDIDDWCSADAEYSTIGGTADKNAGGCWDNSGPLFNRWFYFDAITDGISITIDIGDAKGNQQRSMVALWESDGTTPVACEKYDFNGQDVNLKLQNLTPGTTYYISVDTYSSDFDGTFTLCVDDDPTNDFHTGAFEITDINNWCSSDAEFSTIGGTSDLNAGSCWNNSGPQFNQWFSFDAVTDGISVKVERGGAKGTQQRTQLAIWEANATTQIACDKYDFDAESVLLEVVGLLTPGDTYFISVDSYSTDYDGTFTLCVNDLPSHDYYEGAYEITNLNNWCSSDAQFTTIGASADLNAGSCWDNSGPLRNKWFRFTSIGSDVDITIDIGSGKGTQQRTQLALWGNDGTTQIDCNKYVTDDDDVAVSYSGLTTGNNYYISVDTYSDDYDGTFSICISNIDETFYSIGSGSWNDASIWSTTSHSGSSNGFYPQAGDVANIEGHIITVDANQDVAQVNLNVSNSNTGLTVNGVTLDINGQLNFINAGNNFDGNISVVNGGILDIQDDLTMTRSGGANVFALGASETSSINVNQNFSVISTSGSTNENSIILDNTAAMLVNQQSTFSTLSGVKTKLSINDDAIFTTNEDINFIANAVDLVEIEVNDNGNLNLGSTILRGTPAYGILDCNDNATVGFVSTDNLQVWPQDDGELTDSFNYINVLVNNSRITFPQITLEGNVAMSGILTLTDGIVETSASATLTLTNGAGVAGGNAGSFVDGPLVNVGNEDFEFPIGDGDVWAPIGVSGLIGGDASTSFSAEYFFSRHSSSTIELPDLSGENLDHVSILEYWNLDVSGSLTSANVTLHWKDAARSEINVYSDLRITHFDDGDGEWENYGADAINSTDPGSVTVNNISSFSPFTFGTVSKSNPLPVELAYFKGSKEDNNVILKWATYSETNNDYFNIEHSMDGVNFKHHSNVDGKGTSSIFNQYKTVISNVNQANFYRLSQVDFDGTSKVLSIIHVAPEKSLGMPFVYPNPSDGNAITIDLNAIDSEGRVEIFNLTGKPVFEIIIQNRKEINLNGILPEGIYFLKISTKNQISRTSLIIR